MLIPIMSFENSSEFFMSNASKEEALENIKKYVLSEYSGKDKEYKDFLVSLPTLEKFFKYGLHWHMINDSEGNIIDIQYTGSIEYDFVLVFSKIAPYIKDDSWIQLHIENKTYRLVFKGGQVKKIFPKITMEWNDW